MNSRKLLLNVLSVVFMGLTSFAVVSCNNDSSSNDTISNQSDKENISISEPTTEESSQVHEHVYSSTITKQPTCTETGVTTYTCNCGDSYTEEINKLEHSLTHHLATESTCTETGNYEHWTCDNCEAYFLDENATYPTLVDEVIIPLADHTEVIDEAVSPTCKDTGLSEGKHCSECGEILVEQKLVEINKNIHVYEDNVCINCGFSFTKGLEFTLLDDGTYSVGVGTASNEKEIVIPYTYNGQLVTTIKTLAFYDCSSIESIIIPDSVVTIEGQAFNACKNLTSITIGNNVKTIGTYAFYKCSSLESITIPDSVEFVDEYAFYGCSVLKTVTIGNGMTVVSPGMFSHCPSLTDIVIPTSVTTISAGAFSECKSLTTIKYQGTEEQWNAIEKIEGANEYLEKATVVYNYVADEKE